MPSPPSEPPPASTRFLHYIGRKERITIVVALLATVLTGGLRAAGMNPVLVFTVSAIALASIASLVGDATDELGHYLNPGATGVVQSALGNLPELFISIFALRAGLSVVVQTSLIGSILANSLLVLGFAFLVGGLKHGVQKFGKQQTRMISMLLVLSVAALTIPAIATARGAPDAGHAGDLSLVVAVVLLVIFCASIPFSLQGGPGACATMPTEGDAWPLSVTIGVLVAASLTAAFVSDWFVDALKPTMAALGLAEGFVGLVIVAIAGNAVEHVVGVQMALRNDPDTAISLILNSSLQVALGLIPLLVILSRFLGGAHLSLVLSPILIAALALSAFLGALIVYDGESTWLEGLALIGLYVIIAASFWWGPAIKP